MKLSPPSQRTPPSPFFVPGKVYLPLHSVSFLYETYPPRTIRVESFTVPPGTPLVFVRTNRVRTWATTYRPVFLWGERLIVLDCGPDLTSGDNKVFGESYFVRMDTNRRGGQEYVP